MLGPFDYGLWVVGFAVEAFVVVCSICRRDFLRYFSLNFYLLAASLTTAGHFWLYRKFGFSSIEYRYYYYYSETLLIVLLYFGIMQLYQRVFREMHVSHYIRGGALLLLGATALFSYLVVHQNVDHLTSRFVVELSQNLYFVGLVLTYLLWGALLKLRETHSRLVQFVLALGIYFSLDAAGYALRNLFPGLEISFLKWVPPLAGVWLPLAWAYTFTRVPEDARLQPHRLIARVAPRVAP